MSAFHRLANLLRRSRLDHEIDAELRAHIDLRTEAHIAAGMDPSEARRKALLQFGSRAATQERVAAADSFLLFASIGSGRVSRGELSPRAEAELSASGKIAFSESLLHQNALIRTEATPADCLANCNGARKAASATLE